ncbi:MAG: type I-PGING CRISPR-associated protein Cas7/Csp1 [Bacteroidota bacterium]
MEIKGILITSVAPFDNHMANGGEKLLGNASSIKRRPDGKVYISGQMQRHVLFSAIDRLNQADPSKGETIVSNGDGISNKIELDLRADMGGFMHPSKGDYSGRRTAPLSVTPATAIEQSEIGRDLLIRLSTNIKGEKAYSDGYLIKENDADGSDPKKQALAIKEFSQSDQMHMNFFLDVSALGLSKAFKYENQFHIETLYFKHVKEEERIRRVRLFIEATHSMNDYANQARNAVCGEPQKVLIVFDENLSRKAARFFIGNDIQRKNILTELEARGSIYFYGDDTEGETSVYQAYQNAIEFLTQNSLYDPSEGDESVLTFAEAFEKVT